MDTAGIDATEQARLVRDGEASAVELVDDAIARIEATNANLNAVIRDRFEQARTEAAGPLPDGPFRGVPILFKDLGCEIEGESLHEGMRFLKDNDYRSRRTDALAARFIAAGFVCVGRTNTPEIGLLPTTEPEAYGPTHNPWRAGYTTGGSSGGSAAAVASGMVAIAHANDGGGSIRIPASCCGLVGLKPTRGRVPIGGDLNEISNFLIAEGVVTRTVRDTAGALDALSAPRHGGATRPAPPARPYRDDVGRDPGPLRIGILTHDPVDTTSYHPECVAAVVSTASVLERLGHHMEISYPPEWARPESLERFTAVWAADCAYVVDDWAEKVGREVTQADVEPLTWVLASMGRKVSGPKFIATVADGLAASARAAQWWRDGTSSDGSGTGGSGSGGSGSGGFDLLLTPTLAEPPVPHGTFPSTPEHPLTGFARAGTFVPFTTQANVSGQPAVSLPMHSTPDGLPVGVQLVAAFGREDLLIQVAAQLEGAAPWAYRSPPAAV